MGLAHPAERNELPPPGVPMAPRKLVERLSSDYGQIPILGLPFADPPRDDNMATKPTPGATVPAFNINVSTAPAYWFAGGLWTVLADGAATDGSYCLFEQLIPKGPAAPPHMHRDMDEVFYMLDGEAEFLVGNRRETARKGTLVFIPRGTVHGFRVVSDGARFLNLYTPAGFDPGRKLFKVLQVGRAEVEVPQRVAVLGLEAYGGRCPCHAVVVVAPLA